MLYFRGGDEIKEFPISSFESWAFYGETVYIEKTPN
jgi:hypothetical protein